MTPHPPITPPLAELIKLLAEIAVRDYLAEVEEKDEVPNGLTGG